ncbi:MAG TPA: YihY/virulence factor BrkB family protein [Streptosporangiaceae bacterium]|nr:YihY/virulence factor BrkB family protein [Streptosporangiaceae bacterium]
MLTRVVWLRQALVLLRRAFAEFRADHCPQFAAAISFHLLFSVFPLAITAVGIIGLMTQDPHARDTVLAAMLKVVPLSAQGKQQLHGLLGSVSGGAGALGLLGLLGVIWSAGGVMAAIRTALNVAWDTSRKRPFVRGKAVDLALVAGVFAVTGAALGLTVAADIARQGAAHLPGPLQSLAPLAGAAASVGVFAASAALLFATFAFLYRIVPAAPTRVRGIWPGALAATAGFEALQYGFSVYLAHFAHYNKVYGSLGAVIAFLFFIYLASMVFLFGAEVASEYPRLRAEAHPAPSREDPGPPQHIPGAASRAAPASAERTGGRSRRSRERAPGPGGAGTQPGDQPPHPRPRGSRPGPRRRGPG